MRCFIHIVNDTEFIRDGEGEDFSDRQEAAQEAAQVARDLMAEELRKGKPLPVRWKVLLALADDTVLMSLPFSQLIPAADPLPRRARPRIQQHDARARTPGRSRPPHHAGSRARRGPEGANCRYAGAWLRHVSRGRLPETFGDSAQTPHLTPRVNLASVAARLSLTNLRGSNMPALDTNFRPATASPRFYNRVCCTRSRRNIAH